MCSKKDVDDFKASNSTLKVDTECCGHPELYVSVASQSNPSNSSSVITPPKNSATLSVENDLASDITVVTSGLPVLNTHSQSSATGTLRNKYALAPGHSLMDWIRLGSSVPDLTGLGHQAGKLSVTKAELSKHNKINDAWLCVRGLVFNVTPYLSFHPGGPEEVMKGVGTDATGLFESVHPWVNYEQMLGKCCIGVLSSADDMDKSIGRGKLPLQTPGNISVNLPSFAWMQTNDYLTLVFTTLPLSNPMIEIVSRNSDILILTVSLFSNHKVFVNEINLPHNIEQPCEVKVEQETGKIQVILRKSMPMAWRSHGVLDTKYTDTPYINKQMKYACILREIRPVNHNTFFLDLERKDGSIMVIPLGKHINIFLEDSTGEEIFRPYTPVPINFMGLRDDQPAIGRICLMVKRYADGNFSKLLTNLNKGQTLYISRPLGTFNLQSIINRDIFMLLAAGTGITPMIPLIIFLLELRLRKCQCVQLLFFNKNTDDILLQDQLKMLERRHKPFIINYYLSEPDEKHLGDHRHTGTHISQHLLDEKIKELLEFTCCKRENIFFIVCGPQIFNNIATQAFTEMDLKQDQYHIF